MSAQWQRPAKDKRDTRPYTGDFGALTAEDVEFFSRRYEIDNPEIRRGDLGRYVLPVFSPLGAVRGHVARAPWAGSPLAAGDHRVFPKADTYMSEPGPVQSFYGGGPVWEDPPRVVVVVEDQLSAIKLAQLGYAAVALLGAPNSARTESYSGQDRVAEITRFAGSRPVVLALDADMVEQSFLFARKWGDAFTSLRVAILDADIKDTPKTAIPNILGVSP